MSASLDSTAAHTGQSSQGDWQEQVYQRIKFLKEGYLEELIEMYQKIVTKLQHLESDKLEKLNVFKVMLECIITFLQVSKSQISPSFKEKLGSYEKHIINFINTNRPRNTMSSLQYGELPPPRIDWQEEVYQKIKSMKECYLPELNEMYQKITTKLEQQDSLPQQPKPEQLEMLKVYKMLLERIISFLHISKSNISPNIKEKLGLYEKHIINFINRSRHWNPLQSAQLPPPHIHSMSQSQPQVTHVQSYENQMNSQLQTINMQDSVAMLQQNMASMTLFDVCVAQPSTMNSMQPNTNLDSDQEMLLTPCNTFQ